MTTDLAALTREIRTIATDAGAFLLQERSRFRRDAIYFDAFDDAYDLSVFRDRDAVEFLPIVPFDPECVKSSAYELHVGFEAFVTRDRLDSAMDQRPDTRHECRCADGEHCIPGCQNPRRGDKKFEASNRLQEY